MTEEDVALSGTAARYTFIRTGFAEVERRDCFESRISDIHQVEDPSRIRNGEGVCVECVKPTG